MTRGPSAFCGTCGRPFAGQEPVCSSCGRPRGIVDDGVRTPPPPASPPPAPPRRARRPGPSVAGRALGAAGIAGVLPWQTVVGGQQADIGRFLTDAGAASAKSAVRASLRRPGLALAVTTVLDLAVASLAGDAALQSAIPRAGIGLLTGLLAVLTGRRGGFLRVLSGLAGAASAVAAVASGGLALLASAGEGGDAQALLPQAVTLASCLVVAVRTAVLAFRRPR